MASVVEAFVEAAASAPVAPPLAPLLPGSLPTEDELRGIASWTQLLAMAGLSGPWTQVVDGVETTVRPRTKSRGQAGISSGWQCVCMRGLGP